MRQLQVQHLTKFAHLFTRAHLSASSRMMILWRPRGSVTFFCANILILLRTTSIPLSKSQS